MSDTSQYLDAFPSWLKTLATDVSDLAALLGDQGPALPEGAKRAVIGAINYLFKSLDLVPDGIEDLGFVDDAFVVRVSAQLAAAAGGDAGVLKRLSGDAPVISSFMGADYARLERYVLALGKGATRGRTVDEIMHDPSVRSAFLSEVSGWVSSYEVPTFTRDEKVLVKLKSFLDTKLPR